MVDAPILVLWAADIELLGTSKTFAEHDQEMAAYCTPMTQLHFREMVETVTDGPDRALIDQLSRRVRCTAWQSRSRLRAPAGTRNRSRL